MKRSWSDGNRIRRVCHLRARESDHHVEAAAEPLTFAGF